MVARAAAMWSPGRTTTDWPLALALAVLTLIVARANSDHFKNECHQSYYNFPVCVPNELGYDCECGPGFFWNTHSCVALGIDSRLEFAALRPARYTLLLGKPLSELSSFTIGLWLNLSSAVQPGTVLSYKHNRNYNLMRITTGPTLQLQIFEESINTGLRLNASTWFYLAWTWASEDGSWELYINGDEIRRSGVAWGSRGRAIPGAGELVLGQSSRTPEMHNQFDLTKAFKGEMALVNIWHRPMTLQEVQEQLVDCTFKQCGDAVEWADFRSGTRGAMKIRWPSTINIGDRIPCFSKDDSYKTCDKYCSHVIGALCRGGIAANIAWGRTPVDTNASHPCPGLVFEEGQPIAYATRVCRDTGGDYGVWEDPVIDDCISQFQLSMKNTIMRAVEEDMFNTSQVLVLAERLLNGTAGQHYRNPLDIAAIIESVQMLMHAEGEPFHRASSSSSPQRYVLPNATPQVADTDFFAKAHTEKRNLDLYRDFSLLADSEAVSLLEAMQQILTVVGILDHIVFERNSPAWLSTLPPGVEGDKMLKLLEGFLETVYEYLEAAVGRGDMDVTGASMSVSTSHMGFHTRLYLADDLSGIAFPQYRDKYAPRVMDKLGSLSLAGVALVDIVNNTDLEHIGISMGRFEATSILPNHNVSSKSKEDNVNSAIVMLMLHTSRDFDNLSEPLVLHFPYINNDNISNPECVHLLHGGSSARPVWQWGHGVCNVVKNTSVYAVCHCSRPGIFAVTTDMYNIHWNPGEEPVPLMQVPSYVGCSLSAIMCLISCLMLIYLRTSSKTALIHKNFAMAVVGSQVTFMFGIDKFQYHTVCQAFAIAFHYFFLAVFAWLMNEAFNLYIVITYAAHAHDDHDASSQWRYYTIGWVLPAVLVGAFVGTHTDDYYAPDMCWIAWQYIWLFLGPAIGIISVTVLVLIFTAKEHHESAYAKNEQTNKMISIHAKALWTQVILLTVCWAFAFLTLKMRGIIIKCLFAMFNCLQGAFFVVFYFLLNEEVRAVLSVRRKRKTLAKHGYDYSPSGSDDSGDERNECVPADHVDGAELELEETKTITNHKNHKNGSRKRKNKSQIEVSSDEASDCEMMITSV